MENMNVLKKFTTAAIGLDKASLQEIVKTAKKPVAIVQVLALITRVKEEKSTKKADKIDYRFGGQFEAVNLLTKETFHAVEAYFPGAAEQHAMNAYQSAVQNQGEAQAIAFTITVEKDPTPNSATGYKFGLQALVNKEANDPFANLRKALAAK